MWPIFRHQLLISHNIVIMPRTFIEVALSSTVDLFYTTGGQPFFLYPFSLNAQTIGLSDIMARTAGLS